MRALYNSKVVTNNNQLCISITKLNNEELTVPIITMDMDVNDETLQKVVKGLELALLGYIAIVTDKPDIKDSEIEQAIRESLLINNSGKPYKLSEIIKSESSYIIKQLYLRRRKDLHLLQAFVVDIKEGKIRNVTLISSKDIDKLIKEFSKIIKKLDDPNIKNAIRTSNQYLYYSVRRLFLGHYYVKHLDK